MEKRFISKNSVRIDNEYFNQNVFNILDENLVIFDKLDPYGKCILYSDDIVKLRSDCELILKNDIIKDKQVVKKIKILEYMCDFALTEGVHIIYCGD